VHTSAKARPTSVAIRIRIRIRIQIRIRIPDPDRHQNLTICSLAHCQPSLKISCKPIPFISFYEKLLTDKHTDNDEIITSLAEVTKTNSVTSVYNAIYSSAILKFRTILHKFAT